MEGHSLDAQERLFHQLCQIRGWTPVQVYREEGRSAHSDSLSKRPVLRQLLEDAGKGHFDTVVVHTLDRWARNLKVMLETVGILSQHGVGLVSITENLDWSTPEGRLVARTVGSFGEFFSDMLGTHVKKGISERAHLGLHLGSIPFGYQACWERVDGERRRTCQPRALRRGASGGVRGRGGKGDVPALRHRHRYPGHPGRVAQRPGVPYPE